MKKIWVVLCSCILLAVTALPAPGQDASMAEFRNIMNRLKSLKTYSYETETKAVFPDGKRQTKVNTLYMDAPNKRLCYYNNYLLVLLTPKWAFKADHVKKNASVFDVVKYNDRYKEALPEVETIFKSNLTSMFVDSVVLGAGTLLSAKKNGNRTTFTIGFPNGSPLKKMVMVYDYSSQLPESITMSAWYATGRSGGKATGVAMETTSRNYTLSVPEAVFDTRKYFSIRQGKAVLAQYKNYKLTSIL